MKLIRRSAQFLAWVLLASVATFGAHAQTATPPFPVDGRILFNRWAYQFLPQDAYNRLWRIDADGTDIVPLVPALPDMQHTEAAWSRDGRWIAYIHYDQSGFSVRRNLFVEDENGSPASRRRLTPTSGQYSGPSWSPDGQWIAYSDNSAGCVYIVRNNGSERRTPWCLSGSGFLHTLPVVWSGDSKVITLASGTLGPDNDANEVWRVNIDTSVATRVFRVVDFTGDAYLSPDGTKVLYAPSRSAFGEVHLYDLATGAFRSFGLGHQPLWSRDSRKIAFSRTDFAANVGDPDSSHVYVINRDGTGLKRLTFSQIDQLRYFAADWSLDNKRVLVNRIITIPTNIPNLPYGRLSAQMRIFDVATRQAWRLPVVGTAARYGWDH